MDRSRTPTAWSSLDTLLTEGTLGSLSDGQLLDHFQSDRDATGQEAFRVLVRRHGPMVLALCRSLLSDPHEAEDAFQATFLVLVRRADSIRRRETIGPWLHGVAARVARKSQVRSSRRRKREVAVELDLPGPPDPDPGSQGSERAVHDEIRRLPESFRAPVILCCLEGLSYDQAARQLGLSEPTLRGRLHRARKRLEAQLRRRGILAPIASRLLEPGNPSLPAVSSSLIESTTQLASRWSTLSGLLVGAGAVPESIAALAQGVIQAMLFQTVKVCGFATILTLGVVGTLVVAQQEKSGAKAPENRRGEGPAGSTGQKAASTPRVSAEEAKRHELEGKTRHILHMLDDEVKLDLPEKPTLGQFLKAIKQATTDTHFPGLPIYVEPFGLGNDPKALDAPLDFAPPRSGRVRFLLRQVLGPHGLSYIVRDGYMMISSQADIAGQRLEELDQKIERLSKAVERLERANGIPHSDGSKP